MFVLRPFFSEFYQGTRLLEPDTSMGSCRTRAGVFFFLRGGIQVEAVLLLRKCEMYFGVFNYDIYIYTCIIILIDWL